MTPLSITEVVVGSPIYAYESGLIAPADGATCAVSSAYVRVATMFVPVSPSATGKT